MQLLCGVVVFGEPLPPERLAGFVLVWIALVALGTDATTTARRRPRDPEPIPVPEPA